MIFTSQALRQRASSFDGMKSAMQLGRRPTQLLSSIIRLFKRQSIQRFIGVLIIIAAWQICSGTVINSYFVSSPAAITRRIIEWAVSGTLWVHLFSTISVTLFGFFLAAILAIPLALIMSSSSLVDEIIGPFLYAVYSMPKVVLAPALIIWVGIGAFPAILLSAITAFFLIFYNVYMGLKQIPPIYGITADLLGASSLKKAMKFRLPAAAPFVATGLSQGLIYAFHGAMTGEMTASNTGIGYLIMYAGSTMDSTGVMAGLVIIGVIAVALIRLLSFILTKLSSSGGPSDVAV